MTGIIMSIIAGSVMSIQGVFNTRLSEKTGLFESNVIVQGLAFLTALVVWLIWGKGDIKAFSQVNKLYLTGGVLGSLITVTVMLGIKKLSPAASVSIILTAQLLTAGIIDFLGVFGTEKTVFGIKKIIGIITMLTGMLLFKL